MGRTRASSYRNWLNLSPRSGVILRDFSPEGSGVPPRTRLPKPRMRSTPDASQAQHDASPGRQVELYGLRMGSVASPDSNKRLQHMMCDGSAYDL